MAMDPEINQLFEEGATRSADLTDQIGTAEDAVEDMIKSAEKVADKAESEAEDLRQSLKALTARLDRAEDAITSARAAAETELDAAGGKADELKTAAEQFHDRVKRALDELSGEQDKVEQGVTHSFEEAGKEYEELAREMTELQQSAQQQVTDASTALDTFHQGLADARTALAQKEATYLTSVQEAAAAAATQADAWVSGLSELLEEQGRELVDSANRVIARHNQEMETLKEKFVEHAREQLTQSLQGLQDELSNLSTLAENHEQELSAKATEILGKVGEIRPEIATVTESIRKAEGLS
jgi:chromosome segregation ATPase